MGGFAASSHAQGNVGSSADTVFHSGGRLWMQMFADYDYVLSSDTAGRATGTVPKGGTYYTPIDPKNANGQFGIWQKYYQAFDLRRFYLGYDYNMSKDVSAQLLLSHENGTLTYTTVVTGETATYDSVKKTVTLKPTTTTVPTTSSGDIALDANRTFFLKNANVQFKGWIPMASVIFGQQGTAAFGTAEGIWGYRSIEKTIADMRGNIQSNDLGIQIKGSLDNAKLYGYSVMLSNGNGAKQENDKFKKLMLDVNGMFLDKHIAVDVYYDMMGTTDTSTNTTLQATIGYTSDVVSVGAEYLMQTLGHRSTITVGNDATPSGLSVFARATLLSKQLMVFARYDMYDPDSKASGTTISQGANWKESFITAGLDWQPDMTVNAHVIPNIWIDNYTDKSSTALARQGVTVGRVTFAYKF